ncbi:cupin domain-containing protein [Zooshikella sp. RANM57]|uniref:cupin domain-containing protein n=1 Tax=Zooshikella sp. RANM57 TaxID=3425863 RepID=UPI003D6DB6E1
MKPQELILISDWGEERGQQTLKMIREGYNNKECLMSIVSTENAEHYIWGSICDGWHLAKSSNLSVIQERVPPNSSEVRHYHQRSEQFFYVLAGQATLELENSHIHTLKTNQGFHVTQGVTHKLSNQGSEDLHLLVISCPPSHGDRVTME